MSITPEAKGRISGIILGARLIFCALGLQIAGYFYNGSFRSIGIIILSFIFLIIITLFFVIRNQDIMRFSQSPQSDVST